MPQAPSVQKRPLSQESQNPDDARMRRIVERMLLILLLFAVLFFLMVAAAVSMFGV
ncbi:MAG TPA: hypothetical protein HA254_06855 [Candidatus Diapherotrites archaeon]|uniref:DUF4044 domain-containing protein n=1 Tax=Candidatus Iainarchaeum sp. TaxID=3101447 RepID=A0A7J4IZM9_9ARCH|nr:hypothetical protein [Candidatus Diapherotrites archaeon]